MIPDSKTNFLYLADCLPNKYLTFFTSFEKLLKECKINFALIPQTKDVWAVDYMPIQTTGNNFVQFTYNPSYSNIRNGFQPFLKLTRSAQQWAWLH